MTNATEPAPEPDHQHLIDALRVRVAANRYAAAKRAKAQQTGKLNRTEA